MFCESAVVSMQRVELKHLAMDLRITSCFPVGGSDLLPESSTLQVLNWLDWEETVLRSQVAAQDAAGIKQAFEHLQGALGSSSYLVGSSLTLADVVIYSALFPVQVSKLHCR